MSAPLAAEIRAELPGAPFTFGGFDQAVDRRAPSAPGHFRRSTFEELPLAAQRAAWRSLWIELEQERWR